MTAKQLDHPQRNVLVAFGLGKLDPAESQQVESHLSECQECCETLLGLQGDTFVDLVRRADAGPGDPIGDGPPSDATVASAPEPIDAPAGLPPELADHPRYVLVRLLGRGGMGDVYQAEHKLMHRPVALKLINEKLVGNAQAVQRFHREVQAAAQLSHPNIVTAFDAEQAGTTHFLVMEYVEGTDLCEVVRHRSPLPVPLACDYIQQVARGLQHAHEKGMVHRDIKPQNLMLTTDGQVKILDFGLAALATDAIAGGVDEHEIDASTPNAPRLTTMGALMGTPDFVSPEQARDAHTADIRSDIYSLGCTFFYLLADRPPFDEGSAMDRVKAHARLDPEPIETVRADVPAEVADVLRRMIAKDPAERFQTPAEVADALAPFVDRHRTGNEPRRARDKHVDPLWHDEASPHPWRAAMAAGGAVLVFGLLALAGTVIYIATDNGTLVIESVDENVEIEVARPRSDTHQGMTLKIVDRLTGSEVTRLRSGHYRLLLRGEFSAYQLSTDQFVLRRGDKVVVRVTRRPDPLKVSRASDVGDRAAPLHSVAVASRVFTGPDARAILSIAVTPDGGRLLAGGHNGRLGLWNIATGDAIHSLRGHTGAVHSVHIAPDGRRAVSGSEDGSIFLWDLDSGEKLRTLDGHDARVQVARFSPDDELIFTVNADYRHNRQNSAWLWNAHTGERVRELAVENGWLYDAEFSPDGRRIAAAEQKKERALLFDTETGAVIHRFRLFPTDVDQVAYSPDGRYLAFGHAAGTRRDGKWHDPENSVLRLIDTNSLEVVRTFHGHFGPITDVAFSQDGRLIVSSSGGVHDGKGEWVESLDQTARVWDVATGRELCRFVAAERTDAVAFTPDARAVLTGGRDMLRLWQLPDDLLSPATPAPPPNEITAVRHFTGHNYSVHDAAFSSDGTRAISHGAGDGTVRLWDLHTGDELRRFDARCGAVAFSHDGQSVIAGTWNAEEQGEHSLIVWQADTGEEVHRLKASSGVFHDLAVSPDGRLVASSHGQWWGPHDQRDNTLRIWDIQQGRLLRTIDGHQDQVTDAVFSPDGRHLLSAGRDGTVRLWNVDTGEELHQFSGTGTEAFAVAFASDDRVLAGYGPADTGIKDGIIDDPKHCIVIMWDAETGDELRRFAGHNGCIKAIDVSPDGRLLLTASGSQFVGEPNPDGTAKQTLDNSLRLWDLDTGEQLAHVKHRTSIESARFSPDGRRVLTSQYRVFTLWQLPSHFEASPVAAAAGNAPRRQLTFASDRTGDFEILLADEDGTEAVNLTNHPAEDTGPAWSPDGRHIAFCSNRTGNLDLFVMQADGSNVRQLTTYPGIDRTPCWSPDGTKIAFVRHLDDDNWDVFAIDADGSNPVNLTRSPTDEADPAWSPDGTHLLFSGAPGSQLSIMNADGTGHRMLSPRLASFTYPAWSPGGRRIVYTRFTQERDLELFVIHRDGTTEEQLTTLGGLNTFAAWSPDGRRIAFQHRNPNKPGTNATLYIMDSNGDNPHAITDAECHIGYGGGRPAWRPR